MRSVRYGSQVITYSIQEREGLKSHYITVEKHSGVVLKGKAVSGDVADRLILKKAKWIIEKLAVVKAVAHDRITTGSRLPYLGKSYYVKLVVDPTAAGVAVAFTHSQFVITLRSLDVEQDEILNAVNLFYRARALEKLPPRVEKLAQKTGFTYQGLQIRKMTRRWGSCTGRNRIILNADAIKLPYSLIDYLIVHELVHTRIKDHSKAFWSLLARYVPQWKALDEQMRELKM
ncbi:M48 family metallopeptidase [Flavisolibacter nicotianae]|uniref:M48 family metallopeptidase n=1 Tax=Flavisolibacter nicotianae TaxID=2364882 RepID=UPI000EAE7118|nr:SprT family zinc-dependent metalloprotease [Flavisolibacter nicotianae]